MVSNIIHTPPAVFYIAAGGIDVTNTFTKYLISVTVTAEISAAGKCEILLDDAYGQLAIPGVNEGQAQGSEDVTVGLGWTETGPTTVFEGFLTTIKSKGSRHHGRTLLLIADSTNFQDQAPAKSIQNQHADNLSFSDVASKFAPAGLVVKVLGSLGQNKRAYWSMGNESFLNFINRTAKEQGGEVSMHGNQLVVAPIGHGQSASGEDLPQLECDCGEGGNVLDRDIFPEYSRTMYTAHQTMQYDALKAVLNNVVACGAAGAGAAITAGNKFKMPTEDQAKQQSDANLKNQKEDQRGWSLVMIGEPKAVLHGTINLQGARPGVDGLYQIKKVTHTYVRGGGFDTDLQLANPGEAD